MDRLNPRFDLYLNQGVTFLLSSIKKSWRINSTFTLGTKNEQVEETDTDYVGTLKSNFFGSEWNVTDISEDG